MLFSSLYGFSIDGDVEPDKIHLQCGYIMYMALMRDKIMKWIPSLLYIHLNKLFNYAILTSTRIIQYTISCTVNVCNYASSIVIFIYQSSSFSLMLCQHYDIYFV